MYNLLMNIAKNGDPFTMEHFFVSAVIEMTAHPELEAEKSN